MLFLGIQYCAEFDIFCIRQIKRNQGSRNLQQALTPPRSQAAPKARNPRPHSHPSPNQAPSGNRNGAISKNKQFPKPIRVKAVTKNSHDSKAIIPDNFLNNLYRKERHTSLEDVDPAAAPHEESSPECWNYLKTLVQCPRGRPTSPSVPTRWTPP